MWARLQGISLQHACNTLTHGCSSVTQALGMQGRKAVFRELERERPTCKLLYTTPEQLVSSGGLRDTLSMLYQRCAPYAKVPLLCLAMCLATQEAVAERGHRTA